jgi:hypothetical protein
VTKLSSTVLGFALAGVLGAAVAVLAMNIGSSEATDIVRDDARGTAEVEQLVALVDRLTDRIEVLEKAPPMSGAPGVVAPAAAIPSDPDGEAAAGQPLSPAIDERVKELVKENQASQMERWGKGFANMAKQREGGMLDRLAENHGLNDWQRTEMEKVLDKQREAIGAFFRGMMGGEGEGEGAMDFTKIREKMGEVRKESNVEIQNILSPEQFKAYEADPANQRGGRGPWGGGGGGGGGMDGGR